MKSTFALVKKVSNNVHSINQSKQTRLPSYEIFNPETEDIDTDSSGVSTPDSIGSVISVKMESSNGTPLAGMIYSYYFVNAFYFFIFLFFSTHANS